MDTVAGSCSISFFFFTIHGRFFYMQKIFFIYFFILFVSKSKVGCLINKGTIQRPV